MKAPVVELAANGGRYRFVENWWAAKVRAPILDINSVGVIAGKLSYNSATHNLSAIYGVFYKGTARVACINALGRVVIEGTSIPVLSLAEFRLQEIIDIPDSVKTIEIRIYNTHNTLVGILDSTDVTELGTSTDTVYSDRSSEFLTRRDAKNKI